MTLARRGDVVLRRFHAGDAAAFHAIRTDPDLARYQGWSVPTPDEARHAVAAMADAPAFPPGEWWQVAIADPADDGLLGDLGLHLSADGTELELGITLARHAQGRGRAGRAIAAAANLVFAETPARRIVLITDARNAPMRAVLRRMGLAPVDTIHELGVPELVFHLPRPA
ncbi:MAG: GNAT family N-acetyltransferase [Pseudomonadota bacterium]